jgi:hypothetical protein
MSAEGDGQRGPDEHDRNAEKDDEARFGNPQGTRWKVERPEGKQLIQDAEREDLRDHARARQGAGKCRRQRFDTLCPDSEALA